MRLMKELAFQGLLLLTVLGLMLVAGDLGKPVPYSSSGSFNEKSVISVLAPLNHSLQDTAEQPAGSSEENIGFFKNRLLPYILYLLAAEGYAILLLENMRLWQEARRINPISRALWIFWIAVLLLSGLFAVLLGAGLFVKSAFGILILLASLLLFLWPFRTLRHF